MTEGNRRVLVTGASGFLGRHALGPLKKAGFEVHGVARGESPSRPGACAWHRADLLDGEVARELCDQVKPTHLLHLAWYAVPGLYWMSPENARWLEASRGLLRSFVRAGGSRAVIAGTCAEYDWTAERVLCRESESPLPMTPYGKAKAELLEGLPGDLGVSWAWGRVFFPFGPHEPEARFIPSTIGALLRGEPALLTHGAQIRDFLFVEELGEAFAALLESPVEGVVNIASGEGRSLREVAESVQALLGGELRFGARTAPAGEPSRLVADVSRLQEKVGWRQSLRFTECLERTVSWWKQQSGPHAQRKL